MYLKKKQNHENMPMVEFSCYAIYLCKNFGSTLLFCCVGIP